jgi:hypothetical protein
VNGGLKNYFFEYQIHATQLLKIEKHPIIWGYLKCPAISLFSPLFFGFKNDEF